MSTALQLGQRTQHNGKDWLVVRLIEKSSTLFEVEGKCYIVEESYAQLKSTDGDTDFIIFYEEKKEFSKSTEIHIKGLEPLPWKK